MRKLFICNYLRCTLPMGKTNAVPQCLPRRGLLLELLIMRIREYCEKKNV